MTQEEKDLLLKDLCARLPYGVKCLYKNINVFSLIGIDLEKYIYIFITNKDGFRIGEVEFKNIKPYLFPMSSMTEEQKKEFELSFDLNYASAYSQELQMSVNMIKWLNKNHFDYNGLISKGLALDATGLNIY